MRFKCITACLILFLVYWLFFSSPCSDLCCNTCWMNYASSWHEFFFFFFFYFYVSNRSKWVTTNRIPTVPAVAEAVPYVSQGNRRTASTSAAKVHHNCPIPSKKKRLPETGTRPASVRAAATTSRRHNYPFPLPDSSTNFQPMKHRHTIMGRRDHHLSTFSLNIHPFIRSQCGRQQRRQPSTQRLGRWHFNHKWCRAISSNSSSSHFPTTVWIKCCATYWCISRRMPWLLWCDTTSNSFTHPDIRFIFLRIPLDLCLRLWIWVAAAIPSTHRRRRPPICKKLKFYDQPLRRRFTTVDHRHFWRLINFTVGNQKQMRPYVLSYYNII